MRGSAIAALAVSAALLLAACGPTDRSAPGLYRAYCQRCHGPEGEGKKRSLRLYPNLDLTRAEKVRQGDRAFLRERIAEGYGPMPGFARRLSPQEIESLVDLTLELHRKKKGM